MNTLENLKKYCNKKSEENPELKEEIWDFYHLAYAEVEQGGSEPHEYELAISDIDYIIENKE